MQLEPAAGGTRVTMWERVDGGPGRLMPDFVQYLLLRPRNIESLRRLCAVAERRGK